MKESLPGFTAEISLNRNAGKHIQMYIYVQSSYSVSPQQYWSCGIDCVPMCLQKGFPLDVCMRMCCHRPPLS
jgi:hypothetical protein